MARQPVVALAAAVACGLAAVASPVRVAPGADRAEVAYDPGHEFRMEMFRCRARAKDRLAARLAAGELRLAEAVRANEVINRELPTGTPPTLIGSAGRTHGERSARLLVEVVDAILGDHPDRGEVVRRLEVELAEALGTGELADVLPGQPGSGPVPAVELW